MSGWARQWLVLAWRVVLGAAVLVGLLWVRALAEARYEQARAASLAAEKDFVGATLARARAVRWAAPLNPYSARALDELLDTAGALQAAGQVGAALSTYRAARGSLRASAGLLQTHAEALGLVDDHIAALSVRGRALPLEAELSEADRRARARSQLTRDEGGSGASLLALLGLLVWVGAAFSLAGLAHASRMDVPAAAKLCLGVLCFAGFACFGLGLWAA